jgi:hypothetical protein
MSNPINTIPIQQFIQQVKTAELSNQREIKLDIKTAKILALSIAEVSSRLVQDYEQILANVNTNIQNEPITVQMDGGNFNER